MYIDDISKNIQALNTYPGGRSTGLSDLSKGKFNSSRMTPEFYNLNYTGPAGKFFDHIYCIMYDKPNTI